MNNDVDELVGIKDQYDSAKLAPEAMREVVDEFHLESRVTESAESFLQLLAIRTLIIERLNKAFANSESGPVLTMLGKLSADFAAISRMSDTHSLEMLNAFTASVDTTLIEFAQNKALIPTTIVGGIGLLAFLNLNEDERYDLVLIATLSLIIAIALVTRFTYFIVHSGLTSFIPGLDVFDEKFSLSDLKDREKMLQFAQERGLDNKENLEIYLLTEFVRLKSSVIADLVTKPMAGTAQISEAKPLIQNSTSLSQVQIDPAVSQLDDASNSEADSKQSLIDQENRILPFFDKTLVDKLILRSKIQAERDSQIYSFNRNFEGLELARMEPNGTAPVTLSNLFESIMAELSTGTTNS